MVNVLETPYKSIEIETKGNGQKKILLMELIIHKLVLWKLLKDKLTDI